MAPVTLAAIVGACLPRRGPFRSPLARHRPSSPSRPPPRRSAEPLAARSSARCPCMLRRSRARILSFPLSTHRAAAWLAGVGILLPLGAVVCYLTNMSKYGNNNVLQQTLGSYFHLTEQKSVLAPACAARPPTPRAAETPSHPQCGIPRLHAPPNRLPAGLFPPFQHSLPPLPPSPRPAQQGGGNPRHWDGVPHNARAPRGRRRGAPPLPLPPPLPGPTTLRPAQSSANPSSARGRLPLLSTATGSSTVWRRFLI